METDHPNQNTYAPRPKRTSPMPSTGNLEGGVEYMKLVFFRHDQRIESAIYGKGIQPSSETKNGELHPYMDGLKKDGWHHVYGTGDSEGILAYLERQRIVPIETTTPTDTPPIATHKYHSIMIGGERSLIAYLPASSFIEITQNGTSKRVLGNVQYFMAQYKQANWLHISTFMHDERTVLVLGRNGHIMSSEHITPEHHAQLPTGARITRIEDLGGELKVSAYDNQKVDNLRNQQKSLSKFVTTLTQKGERWLAYEAQELGHRVIYLGRIMPCVYQNLNASYRLF